MVVLDNKSFFWILFNTKSIKLDVLSIIPPLFTAVWTCDIFSNFPVNIPITLLPKSIAESTISFIPSLKPSFKNVSFMFII